MAFLRDEIRRKEAVSLACSPVEIEMVAVEIETSGKNGFFVVVFCLGIGTTGKGATIAFGAAGS